MRGIKPHNIAKGSKSRITRGKQFSHSLSNGWNIQTADVEAAYLISDLRGPPVYLRLPSEIWQACDVDSDCLSKFRDPCVRVKKAMYGLPRSGFDWYMHCHEILTIKLGWKKVANFDSLYSKSDCILPPIYSESCIIPAMPLSISCLHSAYCACKSQYGTFMAQLYSAFVASLVVPTGLPRFGFKLGSSA